MIPFRNTTPSSVSAEPSPGVAVHCFVAKSILVPECERSYDSSPATGQEGGPFEPVVTTP